MAVRSPRDSDRTSGSGSADESPIGRPWRCARRASGDTNTCGRITRLTISRSLQVLAMDAGPKRRHGVGHAVARLSRVGHHSPRGPQRQFPLENAEGFARLGRVGLRSPASVQFGSPARSLGPSGNAAERWDIRRTFQNTETVLGRVRFTQVERIRVPPVAVVATDPLLPVHVPGQLLGSHE